MGVLVHDSIDVPHTGLSVPNLILTLKGTFELQKRGPNLEVPGETVYALLCRVYWYASPSAVQPLHIEMLTVEVSTTDVDQLALFEVIYNHIKARYNSTENV